MKIKSLRQSSHPGKPGFRLPHQWNAWIIAHHTRRIPSLAAAVEELLLQPSARGNHHKDLCRESMNPSLPNGKAEAQPWQSPSSAGTGNEVLPFWGAAGGKLDNY